MRGRDDEYLKQVGMEFKLERTRQRLTQAQLAELSGVNPRTIHVIETGAEACSLLYLKKIADGLGKSMKQFV